MFGTAKDYDEMSSSSSDEDDVQLPKEVYCERTPLLDKTPTDVVVTRPTVESRVPPRIETKKWPQYLAAVVATIGGFIMGTTIGWTAPATPLMEKDQYPFHITDENIAWIAAFMPLGALLGCPCMALVGHKIGRKTMMLMLTIPTLVGWTTIIWAQSVEWIYAGRFLTGFASGLYSVVVPMYTTEIAHKDIRGTLGSYFQLQVNAGILFVYAMGSFLDVFSLSFACAIIPVVYVICVITLIPESPIFYLMKGDVEKARLSLKFFWGPFNNVDHELNAMQTSLAKTERERVPMMKAFQTIQAKRGLFLGLGLMVFQQFSGCNAVIFFATKIFQATGSKIEPNLCTVIIGVMAVISTYVSTLVVDKLGRKILLLYSVVTMGICTFCIGGFFYAQEFKYNISYIEFVPLVALCIFIVLFSLGFGPIPWMMMGEIFPVQIKSVACSIVCTFNWLFVFLVTKLFTSLIQVIHIYNTFWLFTMCSVLGMFFVLFIVPETKGKSMEEIQEMLGGNHPSPSIENQ